MNKPFRALRRPIIKYQSVYILLEVRKMAKWGTGEINVTRFGKRTTRKYAQTPEQVRKEIRKNDVNADSSIATFKVERYIEHDNGFTNLRAEIVNGRIVAQGYDNLVKGRSPIFVDRTKKRH